MFRAAVVAGSLGAWLSIAIAAGSQTAATRPNVVLCMTDDQGWYETGYNGHPAIKTPHLDAMAAGGVRFDRFYAAASVCSPTRGSVLTGRHPNRYRSYAWGCDLPLGETTIAELVRPRGYATGHFGKWHLGGLPNADGFTGRGVPESFDAQPRHPGNQGFDVWFSAGNWFDSDPRAGTFWHNGDPVGPRSGDSSDIVMAEALDFIRGRAAAGQPFLCVIWFSSPHRPSRAIPQDRAAYENHGALADHYGEIAGVDRAMGRLRAELRTLGLHKRTLVWFNSDNGPPLGSTGTLAGGKGTLWEGGIRVPGLLEWPERIPQPLRTHVPAGTVDILPTICDALGIEIPSTLQPIDGVSLLPILEGRASRRPAPLGFEKCSPEGVPVAAAVIDHHWKLMRVRGDLPRQKGPDGKSPAPGDYLFNLEHDVMEQRDVARENPGLYARLRTSLDEFEASIRRSEAEYPLATPPATVTPRHLRKASGEPQRLVDRLAFALPGWTVVGDGERRHAAGALHLDGAAGQAVGIHRRIPLAGSFLQCSVQLRDQTARLAFELGPAGTPGMRVVLDTRGIIVTPGSGGIESGAVSDEKVRLEVGRWHHLLIEFAGTELLLQIDGKHLPPVSTINFPAGHLAGFGLMRLEGAVAFKDVALTAGEAPAQAGAGSRAPGRARAKAGKAGRAGAAP